MVDSEYSTENYKTLKISIETITKSPEIISSVPDYFKTKNCKNAVKKLRFLLRYVPNWCKTQIICDSCCKKWWNTKICFWQL